MSLIGNCFGTTANAPMRLIVRLFVKQNDAACIQLFKNIPEIITKLVNNKHLEIFVVDTLNVPYKESLSNVLRETPSLLVPQTGNYRSGFSQVQQNLVDLDRFYSQLQTGATMNTAIEAPSLLGSI